MLIKYEYLTGEVTEFEVPDEIGAVIVESRHEEFNNNRTETRRHVHYDAPNFYEGPEMGAEDPSIQALFPSDAKEQVDFALAGLTENQREVITALFLQGLPAKEYARMKGISEAAVSKTKTAALKKMKDILDQG